MQKRNKPDSQSHSDTAIVIAGVRLVSLLQVRRRQGERLNQRQITRLKVVSKEALLRFLKYGDVGGISRVTACEGAQCGDDVRQRDPFRIVVAR